MKLARYIAGLIVAYGIFTPAIALDAQGLSKGLTYQGAVTCHEQFLRGEPTKAQRLETMRSLVRASKLGDRGLHRVFHNFEGRYAIDPRIPGVERSVLMQLSPSTSQAKGYRRELLYAGAFNNDPRFGLQEMNRQLRRSWGNTDADLVIRHRASGQYGRVEVKDYSLNSQVTNLRDLKVQIDKMSREARVTGQPQFWINRREVHPEIRRYANRRGVVALGNVSTGRSAAARTMSAVEAMDLINREFAQVQRTRAMLGGGQLAFGALMLLSAAPETWEDIKTVRDPETRTTAAWLRLGEHGSYALSGAGLTISGGALMAGSLAGEGMQSSLYSIGRWGGVASLAMFGVGESFLIARYARGDVTSREFWTEQWILATTGAGSIGGSWLGGGLGTVAFGNPIWTALPGSLAGAWAGNKIGRVTADAYYDREHAELDRAFVAAVYKRYGAQ